jgi:hypothetical protein
MWEELKVLVELEMEIGIKDNISSSSSRAEEHLLHRY